MYTLFGYIISICLLIHLSIVTCYIEGEKKRISHARRKSRSAFFSTDEDEELVPTVDDVPNTSSDEANDFLKKSLVEFFSGVKQTKATHAYLAKAQKRTIRPHSRRSGHHRSVKDGRRRHTVSRVRNDTDTTGTKEGKCKFPFIYDGKTVYQCLIGPPSTPDKKWCSLTSNYDRDLLWTNCAPDGSPVRRSKNIDLLTDEYPVITKENSSQSHKAERKRTSNAYRKHETNRMKNKNSFSKSGSETAVETMKDDIDDVDKTDKNIHSLVSKEVDNFIGSVLSKHGVPDTEQQELLALNAKLSTELAQEVSCKLSNDSIGSTRSECVNKTVRSDKIKRHNSNVTTETVVGNNLNKTSLNLTGGNDELLSNEVDAFISSVLSQHNITATKQKEITKSIKKASTDIADQIDYVIISYAKAGGATNKNSEKAREQAAKHANDTLTPSSIHAAVDSFLSLVLEKHGVPTDEQKEIFDWNAQLSTNIADQVNSIVEKAKRGKKSHSRQSEWRSQLKPNISTNFGVSEKNSSNYTGNHLNESTANSIVNETGGAEVANNETNHVPDSDTLQPIYEKGTLSAEHFDKEKIVHESDKGSNEDIVSVKTGTIDLSKKYDDVSPENDMETGVDYLNPLFGNSTEKSSTDEASEDRGIAPEVVDTVAPTDETILPPRKLQYNVDNEEENMTLFANKEFNKKPQIHFKRKSTNHKKMMGDENWDKYLMDDGWVPRREKNEENSKGAGSQFEDSNKEDKDSGSGGKELNDDEKTMINYVSDSIIQSVNNVKLPPNESEDTESSDKPKEVTYKKLDSGKKPYLIYRVQQRKGESSSNQPGIDRIDTKSQKIIPGAKNINIIIINNRNSSLDLNDIENTIARSSEPIGALNESNPSLTNLTSSFDNTSVENKTSENLFLLINATDQTNVTQMIRKTKLASNNETDPNVELNATITKMADLKNNDSFLSDLNATGNDSNSTVTNKTVSDMTNVIDSFSPNSRTEAIKGENASVSENSTAPGNILDIIRNTETKQNEETSNLKEGKNISYSKILTEYDKDLETSTIQSLRKSGLISMNYAPEEIEVRTYGGNANGHKCMFPFIYDGDTYFNCININRDKPWCSITANYDKLPVWGFCDNDYPIIQHIKKNNNPTVGEIQAHKQQMLHNQGEELISKHSGVKTYGGNANGSPCVIPFVYDGQTHMKCIPRHDGTAWCAASHSYDIHPVWGNCCDNDVYKC